MSKEMQQNRQAVPLLKKTVNHSQMNNLVLMKSEEYFVYLLTSLPKMSNVVCGHLSAHDMQTMVQKGGEVFYISGPC